MWYNSRARCASSTCLLVKPIIFTHKITRRVKTQVSSTNPRKLHEEFEKTEKPTTMENMENDPQPPVPATKTAFPIDMPIQHTKEQEKEKIGKQNDEKQKKSLTQTHLQFSPRPPTAPNKNGQKKKRKAPEQPGKTNKRKEINLSTNETIQEKQKPMEIADQTPTESESPKDNDEMTMTPDSNHLKPTETEALKWRILKGEDEILEFMNTMDEEICLTTSVASKVGHGKSTQEATEKEYLRRERFLNRYAIKREVPQPYVEAMGIGLTYSGMNAKMVAARDLLFTCVLEVATPPETEKGGAGTPPKPEQEEKRMEETTPPMSNKSEKKKKKKKGKKKRDRKEKKKEERKQETAVTQQKKKKHQGPKPNTIFYRQPDEDVESCLLYTSPSPRDLSTSRMPSSA